MRKRGEPGRYQTFSRAPDERSHHAFMVTACEILDATPRLPLGAAPVPIPHDASPGFRRFLEHENRNAEAFRSGAEARAVERLRARGVPPEFQAEWAADIARAECLEISRFLGALPPDGPLSDIPAHYRVVAAAVWVYGGRQQAADWLNTGVPRGVTELTRHHAKRAQIAFLKHLHRARRGCQEAQDFSVVIAVNNFRVLRHVLELAQKQPEYDGLNGARLAAAIDDKAVLSVVFDKVADILDRRGELVDVGPPVLALRTKLRAAAA